MTITFHALLAARMAALKPSWIAYRYGDRDPDVVRQAKVYENWLAR